MNEQRTTDMGTHWVLDLRSPAAGWKRVADMPNPRNHLSGVGYAGFAFAIGGHQRQEEDAITQREVDRYDPDTNTWTRVADTPTLRSQTPAATFVHDGRIVLVGGADRTQHSTTVISAYDVARNRWQTIGHLPSARRATAAGVINGRLVVTTGNDPYPSRTTWISNVLGDLG
jgi:N-acetylneuraminic acid mutarotase